MQTYLILRRKQVYMVDVALKKGQFAEVKPKSPDFSEREPLYAARMLALSAIVQMPTDIPSTQHVPSVAK